MATYSVTLFFLAFLGQEKAVHMLCGNKELKSESSADWGVRDMTSNNVSQEHC